MVSPPLRLLFTLALFLAATLTAQTTASLAGLVLDPNSQAVPGAAVRLSQRVNGFERVILTDAEGRFRLTNLPFQTYELSVEKEGFLIHRESVPLRDNLLREIQVQLQLAGERQSLVVSVQEISALVDPIQTGSYAQMNQAEIERLPLQAGNRGLEAVLVTFPGFAQNANGAIHPRSPQPDDLRHRWHAHH